MGDVCDNCPSGFNPKQRNLDKDAKGDVCDIDDDNDGRCKYNYSLLLLLQLTLRTKPPKHLQMK